MILLFSDIVNYSWVSEAVIATICQYFEFVWTYFSGVLVHLRKRKIDPNRVAALIFATQSEISVLKTIDSIRG